MTAGEGVITVTRWRLLTGVAVVLGAAVIIPFAIAADRPDDRADRPSVGGLAVVVNTSTSTRPDDRAARPSVGGLAMVVGAVAPTRPDDRAGPRGVGTTVQPVPTDTVAPSSTHWTDPFTVGGIAAVFALLGVVIIYGAEHWRGGGIGRHGTPGTPTTAH
jgi:hypothetical protein